MSKSIKRRNNLFNHRKANQEASDFREKSSHNPVYHICPKTGEYIDAPEKVEVSRDTKVLRFLSRYKGSSDFVKHMKAIMIKYSFGHLTETQKQGVFNIMENWGKKGKNGKMRSHDEKQLDATVKIVERRNKLQEEKKEEV